MIIRSSTGAVATVGGDVNRVALKVHVIEQRIIGLEGEVCGTKKLLEKTNTRVEGVEEVTQTHAKKPCGVKKTSQRWMLRIKDVGTERLRGKWKTMEGDTENSGGPHILL